MKGFSTYCAALMLLFVGYVALAGWLPLVDDEVYYWCWAKQLQPSYFDHPPMTAYLTRASIDLFGESARAIRLPACLASVVVLAVMGWIARPQQLMVWVILTPMYTFGAVLLTPDTPLLLFWALYLAWLTWIHQRLGDGNRIPALAWCVGGILLGCDGLSKYTAVLAVPAGFLSFVMIPQLRWREWLPGYLGHGAIAGCLVSPVILFNIQHDFAPMLYQIRHAAGAGEPGGIKTVCEFVGVQLLLFGTLPLILLPWVYYHFRRLTADHRLRASVCLYVVPFTLFLLKSTTGPLEGNWALASYIGFWPVAIRWCDEWAMTRSRQWLVRSTFIIPSSCVVLLAVHLVWPLPVVPVRHDRVTRQWVKLDLAKEAARLAIATGQPVYCPWYQWVALLRYYGADARQLDGITRPSNFTLQPDPPHSPVVYVFTEGPLPKHALPDYQSPPELIENLRLTVRGETTNQHQFLRFIQQPTGYASGGP